MSEYSQTLSRNDPKIHIDGAQVEGGQLTLHTQQALYGDNAAISHQIGNALFDLDRFDSLFAEAEQPKEMKVRVAKVLDLLYRLGALDEEFEGLDIGLGQHQPWAHTLGGSIALITADGFLILAQQGRGNIASAGDYVPAISFSADPAQGDAPIVNLDLDILREEREEQGGLRVAKRIPAGLFQSLHRLGKPEYVEVVILENSLAELAAVGAKSISSNGGKEAEIAQKLALAACLGEIPGFNRALGDTVAQPQPIAELGESGETTLILSSAGRNTLMTNYTSRFPNHVTRLTAWALLQSFK